MPSATNTGAPPRAPTLTELLAALVDLEGGFAEAVEAAGRMLGVRGRVVPSTLADVVLSGRDSAGRLLIGQARIAESEGPVSRVSLEPHDAPAYGPALDAIRDADVVVIGPGSLFTSIIPNFLVSGVTDALRASDALVVYVCNVANMRGETSGMDAADHVDALIAHGLDGLIDVALVDVPAEPASRKHVQAGEEQIRRIEAHGVRVVAADLTNASDPVRHDQDRLLAALSEVW
jgi:uncharacterized cofD-like protein